MTAPQARERVIAAGAAAWMSNNVMKSNLTSDEAGRLAAAREGLIIAKTEVEDVRGWLMSDDPTATATQAFNRIEAMFASLLAELTKETDDGESPLPDVRQPVERQEVQDLPVEGTQAVALSPDIAQLLEAASTWFPPDGTDAAGYVALNPREWLIVQLSIALRAEATRAEQERELAVYWENECQLAQQRVREQIARAEQAEQARDALREQLGR